MKRHSHKLVPFEGLIFQVTKYIGMAEAENLCCCTCCCSMFSSLRLKYGMSTSPFVAGVKVPARGPEEGRLRLLVRYGVEDPLVLSVMYTGPEIEALKARALAWWTSSRSWSWPWWLWWWWLMWVHFHLKKRKALLHQRFFLTLWVFFKSSLEMGFWSLKWMESMDLVVSRLCFLASSKTLCYYEEIASASDSPENFIHKELV